MEIPWKWWMISRRLWYVVYIQPKVNNKGSDSYGVLIDDSIMDKSSILQTDRQVLDNCGEDKYVVRN